MRSFSAAVMQPVAIVSRTRDPLQPGSDRVRQPSRLESSETSKEPSPLHVPVTLNIGTIPANWSAIANSGSRCVKGDHLQCCRDCSGARDTLMRRDGAEPSLFDLLIV